MTTNKEWANFELLDRTSMVLHHLEIAFHRGEHSALDTKEKVKLYKKAVDSLAELYQKLGELDTKALLDVCKDWSVLKDSYLCDCDKAWNFGKLCKYPEKYKDGGCK